LRVLRAARETWRRGTGIHPTQARHHVWALPV
jgi:hypothetical protein